MATVSGRYVTGASGVGTSSKGAAEGFWNHAVPLENERNQDVTEEKQYPVRDLPQAREQRQPLSSQVNGASRPRPKRINSPRLDLQPTRPIPNGLKPAFEDGGDMGDHGNGADLYKPNNERLGGVPRDHSRDAERTGVKRQGSLSALSALEDAPADEFESKWIHRDKLAQIESREIMEMSMRLGRTSRSGSRVGKKSVKSMPSLDMEDEAEPELPVDEYTSRDSKRVRTMSPPLPAEPQEPQLDQSPVLQDSQSQQARAHARRPSASRIPVMTSSPTSGSAEDGFQAHRTRSNSGAQIGASGIRARSGSAGTQNVLNVSTAEDDHNELNGSGPRTPEQTTPPSQISPQHSPQKAKQTVKVTPGSNGRKVSRGGRATSGQQRAATNSAGDSPRRPGTSGGGRPPPTRPEGEPPWIATMYKPDPRLPPEQQMLPTHAKRLAMEQQEKEMRERQLSQQQQEEDTVVHVDDATGSEQQNGFDHDTEVPNYETYVDYEAYVDYEESQGDVDAVPHAQQEHEQPYEDYKTPEHRQTAPWPLTAQSSDIKPFQNAKPANNEWQGGRSSTPATEHGGYNLIPTVQGPKDMGQRLSQRSGLSNTASQLQARPTRVPDAPDEKEQKKKGCGCCIVM